MHEAAIPLDLMAAIEQAVMLRDQGMSWPAVSITMRVYHGHRHNIEWWQRMCSDAATDRRHDLFSRRLTRGDYRVLDALKACPLSALQLAYKLRAENIDTIDRSLERLALAGKAKGHGAGLARRWSHT